MINFNGESELRGKVWKVFVGGKEIARIEYIHSDFPFYVFSIHWIGQNPNLEVLNREIRLNTRALVLLEESNGIRLEGPQIILQFSNTTARMRVFV